MNKNMMIAFAVASMAFSAPAMANSFTGAHVEATAGVDGVTNGRDRTDIVYGVGVGVDAELYKNVVIGVSGSFDNVLDRANLSVGARLGYVVDDKVLLYTGAGYSSWKEFRHGTIDGLRLTGGAEVNLLPHVYTGAEYRYTNYAGRASGNAVVAKIGYRF